jgi:hypothetical protein
MEMMKHGRTLLGNELVITIYKGGVEIDFNINILTNKCALYCAHEPWLLIPTRSSSIILSR